MFDIFVDKEGGGGGGGGGGLGAEVGWTAGVDILECSWNSFAFNKLVDEDGGGDGGVGRGGDRVTEVGVTDKGDGAVAGRVAATRATQHTT